MAETTSTTDSELTPLGTADPNNIPPISVKEVGWNGLSVLSGQVLEETDPNLKWPRCMFTYKKMLHDGTIAPAIDIFNTAIADVPWYVKAPKGYEKELAPKVAYLSSVMKDMDHSFLSFIKQATSYIHYGFAPFEIVLKYRLKSEGSRYNDGYKGIRKLALRSQDTVTGWEYRNKGRDLAGMWQLVNKPQSKANSRRWQDAANLDRNATETLLPISKLLLFRNNPLKDSPIGVSPLNSIYTAWRYKVAYEESQAHGVNADVHGIKTLYLPPQYLKPDATADDKEVFAAYQKIMRNLHVGQESGIILPMVRDDIKGDKLFEFEIINSTGQKSYDVSKIIQDYKTEILTALYADFLILGQSGGGSFALSESKMSVVQIVIRSKLEEIRDVLNHKLVPLLFKENGWDLEVLPTFEFGQVSEVSLDEFSKAWQRISATMGIAKTVKNINYAAEKMGLPDMLSEDISEEELFNLLDGGKSKVGAGMQTGLSSGTGDASGSSGDSSNSNSENP